MHSRSTKVVLNFANLIIFIDKKQPNTVLSRQPVFVSMRFRSSSIHIAEGPIKYLLGIGLYSSLQSWGGHMTLEIRVPSTRTYSTIST